MKLLLLCVAVAACVVASVRAETVYITTSDGVKLSTVLDFPLNQKMTNLTAIVDRSPYGHFATELIADIYWYIDGFVAVRQNMRGTHNSTGNFTIWHNDTGDAMDTFNWIVQQPWSNGKVFSVGASADGIAQFGEMLGDPSMLKAQFIIVASAKGREIMFPGGAFRKSLVEGWLDGTVPHQAARCIEEVKINEAPGPWWNELNDTTHYANVKWPSLMWAGWYDIFLVGNLNGFNGYRNLAAPSDRNNARIVIDPLGHCQAGAKYFPKNLIKGRSLLPILLSFDLFKGNKSPAEGVKAITFYVMGAYDEATAPGNYWTTLDEFPTFTPTPWYFNEGGALSTAAPAAAGQATYVYDPTNPVTTIGGNNLKLHCGPLDQTPVIHRPDVLLFDSPLLADAVVTTGPLDATLYVSSSAVDTDFTVKLMDVYPTGESRLIQDGIVRMRWRNNLAQPELLVPGQVYEAGVSLWNTSYVFPAGHKIRVAVSSSNFPRFSANPNNGLPLTENGPNITAKNTVYMNSKYPSHITLPYVTLAQLPPKAILLDEAEELMMAREGREPMNVIPMMRKAMDRFTNRLQDLI